MASVSLMQDEQLAKDVTLYPTLYDKSDKGYKERILKFFWNWALSTKSIKKAPQGLRVHMLSRRISKISFASKTFFECPSSSKVAS